MSVWIPKVDGVDKVMASHINDLQTGKVDSDGTARPALASVKVGGFAPRLSANYAPPDVAPPLIAAGHYDAFGIMDQFPSGKLVMVYRRSNSHVSGTPGILVMQTSLDQGFSWTAATTIASSPASDLRDVAGGVTPSGRLVIFYSFQTVVVNDTLKYIYSDDEGATWSTPISIPLGGKNEISPYGKLIAIGNGELMQSWYAMTDLLTSAVYVIKSSDDGATWGASITVLTSDPSNYSESSFVYLGGQAIVGIVRENIGTTYTQVKSLDNGATWTNQGQTAFDSWVSYNAPAWLTSFADTDGARTVVCYYTKRDFVAGDGNVSRAVLGRNLLDGPGGWDTASRVDLGIAHVDAGYISVVQMDSGHALGVYYYGLTPSTTELIFFVYPPDKRAHYQGSFRAIGDIEAGIDAAVSVAWSVTGNCSEISVSEIEKVGGAGAWDSQAYSDDGYVHSCRLSFQCADITHSSAMGLSEDPDASASYTNMNYCFMLNGPYGGSVSIYESGTNIGGYAASYDSNTVFLITYDGANIRYYIDGILKRTVARPVGAALYADSSFYDPGGILKNIAFGPMGNADIKGVYKVNGVQVLGAGVIDARVDDAINAAAWDATTAGVLEALRDAAIAQGWIKAS